MKRRSGTIILAMIVIFLSACTQKTAVPLSEEELAYFNGDEFFNGEYLNIKNQFMSCLYEKPEKINLFLLFYSGNGDWNIVTPQERAAVVAKHGWPEEPDCSLVKVTTVDMDKVLKDYMGITLEDTEKAGLADFTYLEEFDAYYSYHGDTNYRMEISFHSGEKKEDLINLFYKDDFMGGGEKVLTLQESGGSYLFLSNETAE